MDVYACSPPVSTYLAPFLANNLLNYEDVALTLELA